MESEVICVYGLDDGAFYAEKREWLHANPERTLVFLDDQRVPIPKVLESDPQVRIYIFSSNNQDEVFKKIAWEFLFLPMAFETLGKPPEKAQPILERLSEIHLGVFLVASDYRDLGSRVINNVMGNVPNLDRAEPAQSLFGKFRGTPALIIGAGPSLKKSLPALKRLEKEALIFAGGSALQALHAGGVTPHFGAAIDPQPPLERFSRETIPPIPFFFQARVSPELLKNVRGQLLWVPGSGNYPLELWLEGGIDPLDTGWTVGTFCLALAHALGCNPIYLVGMDLAFTGGKAYAAGVKEKGEREGQIAVKDQRGKLVYSRHDWVMAARWIDDFALRHPETQVFNATSGGLGFRNLQKANLDQLSFSELHLPKKIISKEKKKGDFSKQRANIEKSLLRCQEYLQSQLRLFQETFPHSPFEKGEFALAEVELEREIAYQVILSPIWNIWKHVFDRKIPDALGQKLNQILFLQKIIGEFTWTS